MKDEAEVNKISHDIKNHLMSMKGYLYIMGMNKEIAGDEKYSENLKKINEKIKLITDLLDSLRKPQ